MNWTVMMSKYILLIVVITLLIVTDSVGSQNVSLTSISDAATPLNLSDALLIVDDSVGSQNVSLTSNSHAATPLNLSDVLFNVDDSVGTQNVSLTSNSHAATPLLKSGADHQFIRLGQVQLQALSPQQRIQVIVDYQNQVRASQGAANMERLKWSDWLASMAKTWAETCEWKYGQKPQEENQEFIEIGQSLFGSEGGSDDGQLDLQARAVSVWLGKQAIYNHTTLQCHPGQNCHEYTQLVWATTRRVGCGIHQCSKIENSATRDKEAHYLVCNYGPAGNLPGVHPFLKGPACSKCSSGAGWCWKRTLCDSECSSLGGNCSCEAICHNCATLDEKTCMCHCGAGWRGVDCSERCTDKDKDCTPNPDAVEGECPPKTAPPESPAKPGKKVAEVGASTSLMKSHHVMMMMFVMITTITVGISYRDAAV